MATYEKLEDIINGHVNGNIGWTMKQIKKLSRQDRARLVAAFRCQVGTQTAFKIAERIITNDF